MVAQGKKEKEYPYHACSDKPFEDIEIEEHKRTLASDGVRLAKRSQLKAKLDDIHALLDHQWTDADIQSKIDNANASRRKFMDYTRDRVVRRRDEAASRGDDAVVARCNKELADMGAGSLPVVTKQATPSQKDLQQQRLAELNRQNRKLNSIEVRKAQVAAKRAEHKLRDEALAKRKALEAEKLAASEISKNGHLKVADDLFGDASDISRAGTPALSVGGTPRQGMSRAGTPMNGTSGDKKKFGQFKKKNMDDDIIANLDLGIDIEI